MSIMEHMFGWALYSIHPQHVKGRGPPCEWGQGGGGGSVSITTTPALMHSVSGWRSWQISCRSAYITMPVVRAGPGYVQI